MYVEMNDEKKCNKDILNIMQEIEHTPLKTTHTDFMSLCLIWE